MVKISWLCVVIAAAWVSLRAGTANAYLPVVDPPGRDSILDWNAIAIEAVRQDHSFTFGPPEQGGPTRASRALAIVHAAMFDAANSADHHYEPYLVLKSERPASLDAAVATAAHDTLVALYPDQKAVFDAEFYAYLDAISPGSELARGIFVGEFVAKKVLKSRKKDGSNARMPYRTVLAPGRHQPDPLHPQQGFLTPGWGNVEPFTTYDISAFRSPPPPPLTSAAYTAAFNEVKSVGEKNSLTRTAEQTEIGLFWAYDGVPGLGVPPRLYNQIARTIAEQEGNTEIENARLFALVNLTMADAGIASWDTKYGFDFWRPIVGIRNADIDGNPATTKGVSWEPLGAPASNSSGTNFTPPFPSYTSGHATFGGALFQVLTRFYGTDNIEFDFISDELNGVTTDFQGNVRPLVVRHFNSLSHASWENAQSRIYLGIHWSFDAEAGVTQGKAIADHAFDGVLRPLP